MRHRKAAGRQIGEQRLDVAQRGLAGRRIADMADRRPALQLAHDLVAVEIARDMAHRAVGVEFLAVEGGDACGFLAAVLQGVQAQRDDRGGAVGAMNTKDAALLAEFVVVERVCGEHDGPAARAVTGAHIGRVIANVAPHIHDIVIARANDGMTAV